jgi:hypothetical protein
LKSQAKALRKSLVGDGHDPGHSRALELVAKSHGYKDWNTLHAAVGNAPRAPVMLGQSVQGRYLAQPFSAQVLGVQTLSDGRWQVVLHFDAPVDVVTFDSFSNFRSRVTKVVNSTGQTFEKTSDGVPHLVLDI